MSTAHTEQSPELSLHEVCYIEVLLLLQLVNRSQMKL